jgi:hypothetical protein
MDFHKALWSVTDCGLEALSPDGERYRIPTYRLLEIDHEAFAPLYVCPLRISSMPGVDIEAFLEIWQRAINRQQAGLGRPHRKILEESLGEARNIAMRLIQLRENEANYAWGELPIPEEAPALPKCVAPKDF